MRHRAGSMLLLLAGLIPVARGDGNGSTAADLPGDPLAVAQWVILNDGSLTCSRTGIDIGVLRAWGITRGSDKVIIAVLDSGVDLDHPDLVGQLWPRGEEDWNFSIPEAKAPADSHGHGTSVAGIACAAADNGIGLAGIAPGCRLMPLKIDGLAMVQNFIAALDYLVGFSRNHPEVRIVVNGSLQITDTEEVRKAVRRSHEAGIVLCFAAGNNGGAVDTPARYPEAITVGAVGPDGARKRRSGCGGAWASAHGPEVDLVAPGVFMVTTDMTGASGSVPGDYNLEFGGTSAAAPVVAAVAALMLSANPGLDPDRVREILEATAADGDGDPAEDVPGFDEYMGWGRVQAGEAVERAAADWRPPVGDVDCQGTADITDVLALLSWLFALRPALPCTSAADANGDGKVNIADAVRILEMLYGSRSAGGGAGF